jgi:hypothetical protein
MPYIWRSYFAYCLIEIRNSMFDAYKDFATVVAPSNILGCFTGHGYSFQ